MHWGRFSQVEATLSIFKCINFENYNYIHLISGNDFPLKTPTEIMEFFKDNSNEYIGNVLLDKNCSWSWHGQDRYLCYYPQWLIQRPTNKIMRTLRILYREFVMHTKIFQRKKLPVDTFYGGSSWFSITSSTVKSMLNYLNDNPNYIEFFKHGVCADEVFFSTLIMQTPFKDNISDKNIRYMDWTYCGGSGGPKNLTEDDFGMMLKSDCIWARKIVDIKIIKKLDNQIKLRKNQ